MGVTVQSELTTLKKKHGLEVTSQIVDGKRRYNVSNAGAGR